MHTFLYLFQLHISFINHLPQSHSHALLFTSFINLHIQLTLTPTLTHSPDKFLRRASWNKDQINAAAAIPPPPVVDINDYAAPRPTGDDNFMRRSSWNKDQINAAVYAHVPAPPVVDINNYVPPAATGEDKFLRRASWNKDQINAAAAAVIPKPPITM